MRIRLHDYGAEIEHRGESSFDSGEIRVVFAYGSSKRGNWLRFLVVRAWPAAETTTEEQFADSRYDGYSGDLPKIRHPDGSMRPVKTDGRVYLFVGDELRTMRVEMGMSDTHDLSDADSLDAMWDHLQQYRVPE